MGVPNIAVSQSGSNVRYVAMRKTDSGKVYLSFRHLRFGDAASEQHFLSHAETLGVCVAYEGVAPETIRRIDKLIGEAPRRTE